MIMIKIYLLPLPPPPGNKNNERGKRVPTLYSLAPTTHNKVEFYDKNNTREKVKLALPHYHTTATTTITTTITEPYINSYEHSNSVASAHT